MTEWEKIVLTAALTLLGGMILFILSEFTRVLIVVPLQKYKEHVQVVFDRMDFYSNRLTNFFSANPEEEELQLIRQISSELRSAATQLSSKYAIISWRPLLIQLHIVPSAEELQKAYGGLVFLSNNLPREGRPSNDAIDPIMMNHDRIDEVKAALIP
jgi:hypothetical protein